MVFILGLTGSIAMGKSFAASEFERWGIPVFDADKTVHGLLAKGGKGVSGVAALFPETVNQGEVDRKKLSGIVFQDKALLTALESVIHPLVAKEQKLFIAKATRQNKKIIVLDIPLLFEKGSEKTCDAVVLVTASFTMQQRRALGRQGMTPQKFFAIRRVQMPEQKKKHKATFIINTGLGKGITRRKILQVIKKIREGIT